MPSVAAQQLTSTYGAFRDALTAVLKRTDTGTANSTGPVQLSAAQTAYVEALQLLATSVDEHWNDVITSQTELKVTKRKLRKERKKQHHRKKSSNVNQADESDDEWTPLTAAETNVETDAADATVSAAAQVAAVDAVVVVMPGAMSEGTQRRLDTERLLAQMEAMNQALQSNGLSVLTPEGQGTAKQTAIAVEDPAGCTTQVFPLATTAAEEELDISKSLGHYVLMVSQQLQRPLFIAASAKDQYSPVELYSFLLTDMHNVRQICYCLSFYVPSENPAVLKSTCLCVIGSQPCFPLYRALLTKLHASFPSPEQSQLALATLPQLVSQETVAQVSMSLLFSFLTTEDTAKLLAWMLLERSVVFHTAKAELCFPLIKSVLDLLSPIIWAHPIVILPPFSGPKQVSEFLEAPFPFVFGCLTALMPEALQEESLHHNHTHHGQPLMIVDCDNWNMYVHDESKTSTFGGKAEYALPKTLKVRLTGQLDSLTTQRRTEMLSFKSRQTEIHSPQDLMYSSELVPSLDARVLAKLQGEGLALVAMEDRQAAYDSSVKFDFGVRLACSAAVTDILKMVEACIWHLNEDTVIIDQHKLRVLLFWQFSKQQRPQQAEDAEAVIQTITMVSSSENTDQKLILRSASDESDEDEIEEELTDLALPPSAVFKRSHTQPAYSNSSGKDSGDQPHQRRSRGSPRLLPLSNTNSPSLRPVGPPSTSADPYEAERTASLPVKISQGRRGSFAQRFRQRLSIKPPSKSSRALALPSETTFASSFVRTDSLAQYAVRQYSLSTRAQHHSKASTQVPPPLEETVRVYPVVEPLQEAAQDVETEKKQQISDPSAITTVTTDTWNLVLGKKTSPDSESKTAAAASVSESEGNVRPERKRSRAFSAEFDFQEYLTAVLAHSSGDHHHRPPTPSPAHTRRSTLIGALFASSPKKAVEVEASSEVADEGKRRALEAIRSKLNRDTFARVLSGVKQANKQQNLSICLHTKQFEYIVTLTMSVLDYAHDGYELQVAADLLDATGLLYKMGSEVYTLNSQGEAKSFVGITSLTAVVGSYNYAWLAHRLTVRKSVKTHAIWSRIELLTLIAKRDLSVHFEDNKSLSGSVDWSAIVQQASERYESSSSAVRDIMDNDIQSPLTRTQHQALTNFIYKMLDIGRPVFIITALLGALVSFEEQSPSALPVKPASALGAEPAKEASDSDGQPVTA